MMVENGFIFLFHLNNKGSSSEATWEPGIKEKELDPSCRQSSDLQTPLAKYVVDAKLN